MYSLYRQYILAVFSLLLFSTVSTAQKKNSDYRIAIRKSSDAIKVDGVVSELSWKEADKAADFFMVLPMDTSKAKVKTEVSLTYDDENLYLLAVCLHRPGQGYKVESLKRDFVFGKNDNFLLFMDPFDDLTNGFSFGANAAGAQWDGTMYEGAKVDLSWDNKWVSVVKNYDDRWVFEAAIPFKSIRYKKDITEWGINFSRLDIQVPEKSSWTPIPRQFPTASLAYTGTLVWDQPPPAPAANVSLIPYALTGFSKSYDPAKPASFRKEVGMDAKIAVTSAMNLDLTVNPDFSQVEVDKQVTNLDRFELFFPERRQFFLENGDHFFNFGYSNIRPFFSRRIGLNAPIQFGARLSGKLDKNWRMGLMDMQTGRVDHLGLPAQNFSVLALQRKVFARSNIGLLMVNKESIGEIASTGSNKTNRYNRNLGFEYNLASSNNSWTGKMMFLKSFTPNIKGKDWVHAANLQYASRKWTLSWQHEMVGKNFTAETGYVPRTDYMKFNAGLSRNFFPKFGPLVSHGPKIFSTYYYTLAGHQMENESYLDYAFNFRDQTTFDVWVAHDFVELMTPFDPTNSGKDTLNRGSRHTWNAFGTSFISKPQSNFTYGFSTRYGGYYKNGTRLNLTADFGYRFQPYVNIAWSSSYNLIQMPSPWNTTRFWLIGPRVDITFTNKLFFTTFFQYNEQSKNMNLNTRFQWRYRPASDFYFVYTDNYFTDPLFIRNRALVLKFTYWGNW